MSDRKLFAMLTSEKPLKAAARLAEEVTGLSAKVFLRACREFPPEWWEARIKRNPFSIYVKL